MSEPADYKVNLDVYSGPLDLLLFLIRRDEIDLYDIPIARITGQYLEYVGLLQEIDPDLVSEFLVLAATLMELKSRMLLPRPPIEEGEIEFADPRLELVHQLLEYKKFKDAARSLEDAAETRAQRFGRQPDQAPKPDGEVEIDQLDIWALFEAFNKLLKDIGKAGAVHKVSVDDTPIALHAEDILDSIERAGGAQAFEQIFAGRGRAEMIGLFLALLELIRQRRVRAMQDRPFSPIYITLLDRRPLDAVDAEGNRAMSAFPDAPSDIAEESQAEESETPDHFDPELDATTARLLEERSAPLDSIPAAPPPQPSDSWSQADETILNPEYSDETE